MSRVQDIQETTARNYWWQLILIFVPYVNVESRNTLTLNPHGITFNESHCHFLFNDMSVYACMMLLEGSYPEITL